MQNEKAVYESRDSILKMLSDDEIAKVSMSETKKGMRDDDEYLDLEKIDQGVQWAIGGGAKMGDVLPKKAVRRETWDRILAKLGAC